MSLLRRTQNLFKKGATEENFEQVMKSMTRIVTDYRSAHLKNYLNDIKADNEKLALKDGTYG